MPQSILLATLVILAIAALRSNPSGAPQPLLAQSAFASPTFVDELFQLSLATPEPQSPPRVQQSSEPPRQQAQQQRDRRVRIEPIGPEQFDRCVEVARDIDPELGLQLARKREKNPAEFEQTLREGQAGRGLLALVQLKERDPALYRLKVSEMTESLLINRVAAQLHEALKSEDRGKIDALTAQLRTMLQTQMAMEIKRRCEYLSAIEEQVVRIREEIEHDAANFRQIVEARFKSLVEQPPPAESALIVPARSTPPPRER